METPKLLFQKQSNNMPFGIVIKNRTNQTLTNIEISVMAMLNGRNAMPELGYSYEVDTISLEEFAYSIISSPFICEKITIDAKSFISGDDVNQRKLCEEQVLTRLFIRVGNRSGDYIDTPLYPKVPERIKKLPKKVWRNGAEVNQDWVFDCLSVVRFDSILPKMQITIRFYNKED